HLRAELGAFVVEHPRADRRLAHALHQLLHEERLELPGGLADGRLRIARRGGAQRLDRERRGRVAGARSAGDRGRPACRCHQMTSSSAVIAPADFSACRIASRSCGVAPSELSALTTSPSLAPGAICTSAPDCCAIVMSARSVTMVWPARANGPGWLAIGVVLTVTERLPCATAHGASVTAWFMTIEPVRALITTLAAGIACLISR